MEETEWPVATIEAEREDNGGLGTAPRKYFRATPSRE